MEDKNKEMVMEVKKGDLVFKFEIPSGASLGDCYDAAFAVVRKIISHLEKAIPTVNKEKAEDKKEEVAKGSKESK